MDIPGSFTCADAPELTLALLRAYTESPPSVVERALRRFLWNSGGFGMAIPLGQAKPVLDAGQGGHFVYHQRTGMLFTSVTMGHHQLLLSYLAALDKTDFTADFADVTDWSPQVIYPWNATAKLADEFIESALGLYLSSRGKGAISVSRRFKWTAQEKIVFKSFARKDLTS